MSTEHESEHKRRLTDSGVLKWLSLWPVFVSVLMAAVSLGGFIAVVRYMSDDIKSLHGWIDAHEKNAEISASILQRVVAVQEGQDKRIKRLEDHEDGRFSNLRHRGKVTNMPSVLNEADSSAG